MPAEQSPPYDRAACPVERTLGLLSGKWRLMVLFRLGAGPVRFNALQRSLAPVTARVLAEELRRLEADGLVWRRSTGEVPPEVHYGLTPRGLALGPLFEAMAAWHNAEGPPRAERPRKSA